MNRKKERNDLIHELPESCVLKRNELPKNITYNVEYYGPNHKKRDFFRIEHCPICEKKRMHNQYKKCSSKSMKKYTINEKLFSCLIMMINHLEEHSQNKYLDEYKNIKKKLYKKISEKHKNKD